MNSVANRFKKVSLCIVSILLFSTSAYSKENILCSSDPEKQKSRSLEIQTLYLADQKERENWLEMTDKERFEVAKHDLDRRKRIGEIFGEGCFSSALDFENAAMIYQHGNVSDHYYQAFVWANRSFKLGNKSAKSLAVVALDRYLVSIDHKQLFGSQAFSSNLADECICLQEVETTVPDSFRQEYAGFTLQDKIDWINTLNNGKSCPQLTCPIKLNPTPKGTIPGVW